MLVLQMKNTFIHLCISIFGPGTDTGWEGYGAFRRWRFGEQRTSLAGFANI